MPRNHKAEDEKKPDVESEQVYETNDDTAVVRSVKGSPPWPLIIIGVVATIVVAVVFIAGWAFIHHQASRALNRLGTTQQIGPGKNYLNRGGFRRGGNFGGNGSLQAAAARGVVTAVNGDTLTVAGQGKTVAVQKSSTTSISGDKTDVAVNDTVVVYGTANSDGSIAATRIVVRNVAATVPSNDGSADNSGNTTVPGA